jgi:hypothetical protein
VNEGNYLLFDVPVVLLVSYGFVSGVHPVVQPRLGVYAVDAEYLYLPGIDPGSQGVK